MKVRKTAIPDVLILSPDIFRDERGFLVETYQKLRFEALSIGPFVQENQSGSQQGTLRGLHYQIRHAQGKLVRVLKGEILDVAVDLRRYASTFGQWIAEPLKADTMAQMWIPPGFAHGFLVLSEWAEVEYKLTDVYAPEWQRTVRWDDPRLNIRWGLHAEQSPLLSERDQSGRAFEDAEVYTSVGSLES